MKEYYRSSFEALNKKNIIEPQLYEKMAAYIRISRIESFEKGLLYIDRKLHSILEPGEYYFWKNSQSVEVCKADMRQLPLEINGQEILTIDKAQLRVNFSATYQISDIVKALNENKEYEKQLYVIIQLSIRNFISSLTFDQLMENKSGMVDFVLSDTREVCHKLGLEIINCGLKDIILPGEIRDIMNQVLVAEKKAQANIIARREETASTRSMLNTAKLLEDNAMLMKLKEMEYLEKIADKVHSISLNGGHQLLDQLKTVFSRNND